MAVSEDEQEDSTEHLRANMANNQRATRAERWPEMTKGAFFLLDNVAKGDEEGDKQAPKEVEAAQS